MTFLPLTASAQTSPMSRLEAAAGGSASFSSGKAAGNPISTVGGAGGPSMLLFLGNLLADTDDPYSLQPFLQRSTVLGLSLAGNHTSFTSGGPFLASRGDATSWSASLNLSGYAAEWFRLVADVGFVHQAVSTRTGGDVVQFPLSVSAGARKGDTEFLLTYRYVVVRPAASLNHGDSASVWQRSTVTATLHTVLDRKASLFLYGTLFSGGGGMAGQANWYPSHHLGFWASLGISSRPFVAGGTVDYWQIYGGLGAIYWHSRHFGVSLEYEPGWNGNTDRGYDELAHRFSLGVRSRWL